MAAFVGWSGVVAERFRKGLACVLTGDARLSEFGKLVCGSREPDELVSLIGKSSEGLEFLGVRGGGREGRGGGEEGEMSWVVADRLGGGTDRVAFPWLRSPGAPVFSFTVAEVVGPLWYASVGG